MSIVLSWYIVEFVLIIPQKIKIHNGLFQLKKIKIHNGLFQL